MCVAFCYSLCTLSEPQLPSLPGLPKIINKFYIRASAMGLPILRTRPSYNTMLSALEGLKIRPSSWDDASPEDFDKSSHDASVNNFLMSIINNEFAWLTDLLDDGAVLSADDQRETLIQEASKRIAERCGRSGD